MNLELCASVFSDVINLTKNSTYKVFRSLKLLKQPSSRPEIPLWLRSLKRENKTGRLTSINSDNHLHISSSLHDTLFFLMSLLFRRRLNILIFLKSVLVLRWTLKRRIVKYGLEDGLWLEEITVLSMISDQQLDNLIERLFYNNDTISHD